MPRYNDLKSGRSFPSFTACPADDDLDERYVEQGGLGYIPKLHWCLVAEVTAIEYFTRLLITLKDAKNQSLAVAFYLDDDEGHVKQKSVYAQVKVGRTVVLLYPYTHQFADGRNGVRLEVFEHIKVLKCSMKEFYEANQAVKSISTASEKVPCHACGIENAKLACASCKMFSYCSKDCQVAGWNGKGHKAVCKVLKDSDVQAMFKVNWSRFGDRGLEFPMTSA